MYPFNKIQMDKFKFIISIFVVFYSFQTTLWAQSAKPTITFYSKEDENDITMTEGESNTSEAPLEIICTANIDNPNSYTYACEWKIFDTAVGEDKPILTRYEENTHYTLTKSGSYGIKLFVTFTNNGDTIEYESDLLTITISESTLSCPDGFSPNGDGINDIFKITHKSIIKFEAAIFNRWGQKLHAMKLEDVDNGWDGRHGGKYVKDGVYFLNINAVGSDGIKYKIKKAINVLKGFNETEETSGA